MQALPLDEALAYIRCPQEWFWLYRTQAKRATALSDLRVLALREALRLYYTHQAQNLGEAFAIVWRSWCQAWKQPSLLTDLVHYAQVRAGIQQEIEKERASRRPGGRPLAERFARSGLGRLPHRIDEFAKAAGLWDPDYGEPGSRLGDCFADCLRAADLAASFKEPLPPPERVIGLELPYTTPQGVAHVADLVWAEVGDSGATVEVHDMTSPQFVRSAAAKARLDVIAAHFASPTTPISGWTKTKRVLYRNWQRGDIYTFPEVNYGILDQVLSTVRRGLRHQTLIPRAIGRPSECARCIFLSTCFAQAGWEAEHLVDPTGPGLAAELRSLRKQLRDVAHRNPQTAMDLFGSLDALLETLQAGVANPDQMRALHLEIQDALAGLTRQINRRPEPLGIRTHETSAS